MERITIDTAGAPCEARAPSREIRIALVLYGGVSLAVYENGVTRCFYDLVRQEGPLAHLLELVDATAAVDVVAGSSAGGINGLLLAAALECGTDFGATADVWRRLGDLGDLLLDVRLAGGADSLLAGKTYYQGELVRAFEMLCGVHGRPPHDPAPFEIDAFVTGTDFAGRERRYHDATGDEIADRTHRTVFQLKYRPERRGLGCPNREPSPDRRVQARILAAVARVTSAFPAAFPPFQVADFGPDSEPVARALAATGQLALDDVRRRPFVDGGVLDNKPFGPALRAIFHRMPREGVVDRRLFFVEPDPDPRFDAAAPLDLRPLGVPLRCFQFRGHESIGDELEFLRAHNARLGWLRSARERAADGSAPSPEASLRGSFYARCRLDALALSLLARDENRAVSAADVPDTPEERARFEDLVERLADLFDDHSWLDSYDADYHLRRGFHLLYTLHERLGEDDGDPVAEALRHTGRVIKATKLVRDQLVLLRNALSGGTDRIPPYEPRDLVNAVGWFLESRREHWHALVTARPDEPFPSEALSAAARDAFAAGQKLAHDLLAGARPAGPFERTVLEPIGESLDAIARSVPADPRDPLRWPAGEAELARFVASDAALFPLQFSSGIYELDEIEVVRVSPVDAQLGLSSGPPRAKIAGDALGHFAAFLRRDWRSNDLLMGRLDGSCQIVRALFDDAAVRRLARRIACTDWRPAFDAATLHQRYPRCPERTLAKLAEAGEALVKLALDCGPAGPDAERLHAVADALRRELVSAAHWTVFMTEIEGIVADHYLQEHVYRGDRGKSPALLEQQAAVEARTRLSSLREDDPDAHWRLYQQLRLGEVTIAGRGGVPSPVLLHYGARAYLFLWSMLEKSLDATVAGRVMTRRARLVLRTPVRAIHGISGWVTKGQGRDLLPGTAAGIVALSFAAAAGLMAGAAPDGAFTLGKIALVVGIGAAGLLWLMPRARRSQF